MAKRTIIDALGIKHGLQRQHDQEFLPVNVPAPHLSLAELADYAARRLPATEILRVSDHLAECAACHSTLAQLRPETKPQSGAFLLEPEDTVPSFDDLAGELDGTLTHVQHEQLAAELARSPAARDALADLAAFRDELAGLPPKHHRADKSLPSRPAGSGVGKVITPTPWRWRTAASWSAGLAALFMVLAVGLWTFTRHSQRSENLWSDANGQAVELAGLPAALRESVETAARTGQLPPVESTFATHREIMAGQSSGIHMTAASPVGTIVRELRPSLRWTSREGATSYLVSCSDTKGGPLLTSPLLPAEQTQWVPPEALQRGTVYQWQVEALHGETVIERAPKPPAGEARFQVLDAVGNAELEKVEKGEHAHPLVLGMAYWRAGLTTAAGDQFHRLAQMHAQSVVAQRLERAATAVSSMPTSASPAADR